VRAANSIAVDLTTQRANRLYMLFSNKVAQLLLYPVGV